MSISLAFAFDSVESQSLYKNFYTIFKERFRIDLSSFVLESDQGLGLKRFCDTYQIPQRICVRHPFAT
jgi:hypothetical protein